MTLTRSGLRKSHAIAAIAVLGALACQREERRFNAEAPSGSAAAGVVTMDTLQPGAPAPKFTVVSRAEGNAYDISEGKRLFDQWNCSGCHAHGGGGMGPALMDNEWIYGSSPENLVATIVEGRPNGMPSFRNRIQNQQLWQLAAYVRSMAGLEAKAPSPGRNDDMQFKVDEQRTPVRTPRASSKP